MNEIPSQECDVGEWFPLEVALKDRRTGLPLDLTGVTVTCAMKRRVGLGEAAPATVNVSDWVPGAVDGTGIVPSGVLWFSPSNLATAGSYDCTLEATKAGGKPWPRRASFELRVRSVVT